jgi:hypothetical protein
MTRSGRFGDASVALREIAGNVPVRRIEGAWAAGTAGDAAFLVALLVVTFNAGGAIAVGVLGVLRMAPSIIAAPLAGVPAGRYPPGRLLLLAHGIRWLAALAGTIWMALGLPLAGLFVLATVATSAGAFVRPFQVSGMPSLARTPGELVAANVMTSTGEGVGAFVGPLAAGIAVATLGPVAAGWVGVVLFAAATLSLVRLPVSGDDAAEQDAQIRSRTGSAAVGVRDEIRRALTAGPAALRKAPGAATVLLDFAAQVFVRGMMTTLIVIASIQLLGLGDPGVGLLTAAYGFGSLVGALGAVGLAGRRQLGPVFAVALTAWGFPLAVIGAVPLPVVAFLALVVSGVANAILDVAGFTLLQRNVPNEARAPVFGLLEATAGIGIGFGGLVVPFLVDAFGDRGALAIAGAILPIAAVATWPRLHRADRESIVPETELALLRGIPLFARLPMTALERLAGALVPVAYAAGDAIMREGDPGDRYVIIAAGEVDVTAAGRPINRCRPGEGIGEIALVDAVPRTATATAATAVAGYELSSADFCSAIAGPSGLAAARQVAKERLARSGA